MPVESRVLPLLSPVIWVIAVGYAGLGVGLVWLAVSLAPWGLLILILAALVFCAAVIAGVVAFGISRLEEDPA